MMLLHSQALTIARSCLFATMLVCVSSYTRVAPVVSVGTTLEAPYRRQGCGPGPR